MRAAVRAICAIVVGFAAPAMAQRIEAPGKGVERLLQAASAGNPTSNARPLARPAGAFNLIGAPRASHGPCPAANALPVDDARALVLRIAADEDFYPDFVLSVVRIESQLVSTALSGKGAYGLMQLMPETAQRFKVDICNPPENIRGGIRLLRALHKSYRNPFYILAAYNSGEQALMQNGGVPPYPETMRFVAQVMNDFYGWPPLNAPIKPKSSSEGSRAGASANPRSTPEIGPGAVPWEADFGMHVK